MTTVVPFDNTALSVTALERATAVSDPSEEILAVTVIPNDNSQYARERGWIDADEEFDPERIVGRLSRAVAEHAADATFDYVVVGRHANSGRIARELRSYAKDAGAGMVVIGSDNAGRVVSTLGSIGRTVATDTAYDVLIVRSSNGK